MSCVSIDPLSLVYALVNFELFGEALLRAKDVLSHDIALLSKPRFFFWVISYDDYLVRRRK